MRYPPALSFTPGRSRVYLAVATLIAIIFIALCAYFVPGNSHFSPKNGIWMLLAAASILWLLMDAGKRPRGQLAYAQGQWVWRHADHEIQGTLRLHFDLQTYMLVSFVPSAAAHPPKTGIFPIKTQWFHLEARRADQGAALASLAGLPSWQALRRAVHAQVAPSHEELAA
jgi:hypothetical protein